MTKQKPWTTKDRDEAIKQLSKLKLIPLSKLTNKDISKMVHMTGFTKKDFAIANNYNVNSIYLWGSNGVTVSIPDNFLDIVEYNIKNRRCLDLDSKPAVETEVCKCEVVETTRRCKTEDLVIKPDFTSEPSIGGEGLISLLSMLEMSKDPKSLSYDEVTKLIRIVGFRSRNEFAIYFNLNKGTVNNWGAVNKTPNYFYPLLKNTVMSQMLGVR